MGCCCCSALPLQRRRDRGSHIHHSLRWPGWRRRGNSRPWETGSSVWEERVSGRGLELVEGQRGGGFPRFLFLSCLSLWRGVVSLHGTRAQKRELRRRRPLHVVGRLSSHVRASTPRAGSHSASASASREAELLLLLLSFGRWEWWWWEVVVMVLGLPYAREAVARFLRVPCLDSQAP